MLPKNLKDNIKEEFNIIYSSKTERNEIFKTTKSICNKTSCLITTLLYKQNNFKSTEIHCPIYIIEVLNIAKDNK